MSAKSTDKQSKRPAFASPSEAEYNELVAVISGSQRNYRDLIDNLDHAVFTLALDGEDTGCKPLLVGASGCSFSAPHRQAANGLHRAAHVRPIPAVASFSSEGRVMGRNRNRASEKGPRTEAISLLGTGAQ